MKLASTLLAVSACVGGDCLNIGAPPTDYYLRDMESRNGICRGPKSGSEQLSKKKLKRLKREKK
jgi:hypothetical protein